MTKTSKMTGHCRGTFFVFLANTEIAVAKSLSSVYSLQSYNTKRGAEWRYNHRKNGGKNLQKKLYWYIHTYIRIHPFSGTLSGTTRVSWYQKGKTIWILLKQKTVSGSGISWALCKSATRSRQITTPAPHHSVFYRPHAPPAAQPTASKHWIQLSNYCQTATVTYTSSCWDQVRFI